MSSQRLRAVAAAILLGGLSTSTVSALALAADVRQVSTARPDRSVFQGEEKAISSAGAKVLRHIAHARNYIHRRDGKAATGQLQEATTLLASINRALPSAVINGQIAAGKRQLEQEGTTDLVPIATSLDELGGAMPVAKAEEHLALAKQDLEEGDLEGAMAELDMIDRNLVYTEVDLPLGGHRAPHCSRAS
jgi:YfdX protein